MSIATRKQIPRLGLGLAGISMTPEESDAVRFADDRFRYELNRGRLIVARRPPIAEKDCVEQLGTLLRRYQESDPGGSPLDLTIGETLLRSGNDRRRVDRLVWLGLGRRPDLEKDVPAIVIDFVSRSKRDWTRAYVRNAPSISTWASRNTG